MEKILKKIIAENVPKLKKKILITDWRIQRTTAGINTQWKKEKKDIHNEIAETKNKVKILAK